MDQGHIKLIGLTGGIATGKSTVAAYLQSKQYPVIDADQLVHQLLSSRSELTELLAGEFGAKVLLKDGSISRPELGKVVFNSPEKLKLLSSIMHPLVRKKTQNITSELIKKGHKVIFNDVPLLYENKLQSTFNCVWLVYCPKEIQLDRLMARNHLSKEDALKRIATQIDIEQKKELTDFVIDNSKDKKFLYNNVEALLRQLD